MFDSIVISTHISWENVGEICVRTTRPNTMEKEKRKEIERTERDGEKWKRGGKIQKMGP